MNSVIANEDYSAHILKGAGAAAIVTEKAAPRVTSAAVIDDSSAGKMALWGEGNDFPQTVIADVRKDPEIGTLLDKEARLLYSGGLVYGTLDFNDKGEEIIKPLQPAERKRVSDWLVKSNIKRYLLEAAKDLYWFYNAFPEVILNVGRTEIIQLCVQPAEICRWEKMDSTGRVKKCFINANFPQYDEKHATTKTLNVIDPYYNPAETLKKMSGTNFIYPLSYPTPGSTYYQLADWNSIRASGWLDVSMAIPKFKKSFITKQLNIKYHVEISQLYWENKYPGWKDKLQAEREKIRLDELTKFNEILTGVEKAGNSIITAMHTDPVLGKEYSLWKITIIDDKYKSGQFLEDGKDASLYKMSAIGLHPALIGTMPNNGMGGAGSNIREAYNLHMMMVRAHQDIILEPLDLVKAYNGWPDDLVFRFRNSFMNTLDAGKETTQTTA